MGIIDCIALRSYFHPIWFPCEKQINRRGKISSVNGGGSTVNVASPVPALLDEATTIKYIREERRQPRNKKA